MHKSHCLTLCRCIVAMPMLFGALRMAGATEHVCSTPSYHPDFWNPGYCSAMYDCSSGHCVPGACYPGSKAQQDNCYGYALNIMGGLNPGDYGGAGVRSGDCDMFKAAYVADGLVPIASKTDPCPEGRSRIAYFRVSEGFHVVRQDDNNYWSQNVGGGITNLANGQLITDPQIQIPPTNGDVFCGYACTCSSSIDGQGHPYPVVTLWMSSVFSFERNHAEMFRRGPNGYLNYFYASPGWIKDDVSFQDMRVRGDISAVYSPAQNHSEVFFQGDEGGNVGYLHYYYVPQADPRWHHDGTSFLAAGKITGHVAAVYSPTRAHSEVFVRGEDRRLHFFYVQGGQWQHDGLGPAGTQALQGDIAAVYSSRTGRNHSEAFYVGQNGLLNYSYVENGGWKQDASHFAAAGTIHGRIAAVYSEARSHAEVFVRGADGLLHFFYLNNGAWAHDGSSFAAAGQVGDDITAIFNPTRQHSEVFFAGTDGRIHHFYVQWGQWQHESSVFPFGIPVAADLTALYAPQRGSPEFFFRGTDGSTHYYYQSPSGGWVHDGSSFQ